MKLSDYLEAQGLTSAEFGEKIGVTRVSVERYKSDRVPEPDTMRLIVEATAGAVTPNDFFGIVAEQSDAAQAEAA